MKATIPLSDIAHGRSGDKGNHANIAIIAYTAAGYEWLKEHLTAERVREYFTPAALQRFKERFGAECLEQYSQSLPNRVVRYEAANVLGLNFVLYDVLAGGASRSLRIDTQGKTLALALLQMPIETPGNLAAMLRPKAREEP